LEQPPAPQVLLVEDEEAHAELIRRAFEGFAKPYGLTTVGRLEEARAQIAAGVPSLVIADLRLPDGNGVELVPAGEGPAPYPVVVMTSHGDEQVAVEAMKAGVLDYVVKSEATLAQMPFVAERALREWGHVLEQRRMAEALRESEEHFRSLIDNAQDLVAIVGEDGVIQYVSNACRGMLGYEQGELTGTSMMALVHPDEVAAAQGLLEQVFVRGRTLAPGRFRVRHKSSGYRFLESVGILHPHERAGRRAVVNSRDITARTLAEQAQARLEGQLRQSRRLETLGTLSAGIAHDFNNLLQAIVSSTELARAKLPADSRAAGHLTKVLDASVRARDLVRQVLTFSRQVPQERQRVRLQPIIEEIVALLRPAWPDRIEMRSRIANQTPVILGDATQIHQVVMNLCTNARQAMAEGPGRLEISLEPIWVGAELAAAHPSLRPGPHVRISVSDDGCGMTAEARERAFEPFFTTKEVGQGSGLGLSVAHGIVHSHGGDITIESQPGQGSTFHVYLPSPDLGGEPEPAPTLTGERRLRILFVDDEQILVHIGRSLLEGMGHEVTGVGSGAEALASFRDRPGTFDLVLADLTMPGESGLDLAEELRRARPSLPVVLMTAERESPDEGRLRALGIAACLAKPFALRDVAAVIEQVFGTAR
jgi:PAS domain S-box-containing protein